MATLSSPGVGSGLDVNSIVTQLVAIERKPIEQLQARATAIQTQLSSFGLLQSYVTNVRDIAAKLADAAFWSQTTASSSDSSAVAATSTTSAAAGSYSVEVSQIAQAQGLASARYTGASTTVGSGTLHIERGTWNDGLTAFAADASKAAVDIAIGSAEGTLEAIRDKINAAGAGIAASIVTDAGGARLSLRSTVTGASSALRITVADADGGNNDAAGLSGLAFNPPTASGQMAQTLAARDARATINGLEVVSAGNTLTGAIDGVTLTLAKPTTAPVGVQIAVNSGAQRKAIGDFVQAYSDVVGYLAAQTKYDPATKKAAALQGDRATLSLQGTLRSAVQQAGPASSAYARLSDIGLETQTDGTLKINEARLSAALARPAELAKLFGGAASGGGTDASDQGFAGHLKTTAAQLLGSGGLLTTRTQGLRDGIQRNKTEQQRYEARVEATKARLTRQYTALDTTVSRISGTGSSLTQSLAALTALTTGITSGR